MFVAQFSFCVFSCAQLSANFLKIAFFKKKGAKSGFPNFLCLSLTWKNIFFRFAKTQKEFRPMFVIFLLKEKRISKKMITGISGFVFLPKKWPFRDAPLFFKNALLKTLFL